MPVVFLLTLATIVCSGAVPESGPVLPLAFEPNQGQFASEFEFTARTQQGTVGIGKSGIVLRPANGKNTVRMRIAGASPAAPEPLEKQVATSNYFVGSAPSSWRTGIPQYGKLKYSNIYPGVDLVYYGTGQQLEYDFVLAPGRSPQGIELVFEGARKLRTDRDGNLLIDAGDRTIRQLRPRVYQMAGGERTEIAGSYRLLRGGRVQFALGPYDRSRQLVIDPVVQFVSYTGRGGLDTAVGVVTDPAGNVYIAGSSNSSQLATSTAYQNTRGGETDAYVAKFSASGVLQYLTYFGGSGHDWGQGVAVDAAGNAYVAGVTYSTNLPASGGPQTSLAGDFDAFVAKFNSAGTQLTWATYIGGAAEDWLTDVAVDSDGAPWVTGWTRSSNFPTRSGFQAATAGGGRDVFLTRVAPNGQSFTWSSYFGAEGDDIGSGLAIDSSGMIHLTGATTSNNLPAGAATRTAVAGSLDAFVAKLNPVTNQVIYGRLLGGSGEDLGGRVAADVAGNSYVVGYTKSASFPVTRGASQSTFGGNTDIFVAKVNGATGAAEYTTFLGGNNDDWAGGIAVDAAGSAYISGWTNSSNFPLRNPIQSNYSGGEGAVNQRFDAVVARVSPGGDALLYSSYYGGAGEDKAYGIALERSGSVAITGTTTTRLLAGASEGLAAGDPGNADAFLTRLSADSAISLVAAQPASVSLTARLGDTGPLTASVTLNTTGTPVSYVAAASAPWVTVTPENGQVPRSLTISVNTASLQPGTSTAEVTIRTANNSVTIPVTVNVIVAPTVATATPAAVPQGQGAVTITLTGSGFTAQSVVEVNGIAFRRRWSIRKTSA